MDLTDPHYHSNFIIDFDVSSERNIIIIIIKFQV